MKKIKIIIVIMTLMIAISALSGCVGCEEKPFIVCGKITNMSSGDEWKRYDVLVIGDEFHSIRFVSEEAFAVMRYACQNNCNVSVTIDHYGSGCDKFIHEATLLEC